MQDLHSSPYLSCRREQFSENTTASNRVLEHTRCVFADFETSSKTLKVSDTLTKLSMDLLASVLSELLFDGTHFCLDVL